jgi:hypothetical protein
MICGFHHQDRVLSRLKSGNGAIVAEQSRTQIAGKGVTVNVRCVLVTIRRARPTSRGGPPPNHRHRRPEALAPTCSQIRRASSSRPNQRASRSCKITVTVSPACLPMALRVSALTGSLWLPSPNAMNELALCGASVAVATSSVRAGFDVGAPESGLMTWLPVLCFWKERPHVDHRPA